MPIDTNYGGKLTCREFKPEAYDWSCFPLGDTRKNFYLEASHQRATEGSSRVVRMLAFEGGVVQRVVLQDRLGYM